MNNTGALERAKCKLEMIIRENGLISERVMIEVKTLSPKEAIGEPARSDYPITKGQEKVIESRFSDKTEHVFNDAPRDFSGTV